MDRDEAHRALEIIRRAVSRAQDAAILENWGLIFLIHGLLKAATAAATQQLALRDESRLQVYLGLWSGMVVLELLAIAIFRRRRTGERTWVERQVWLIWGCFYAAAALWSALHLHLGFRVEHLPPALALLSAYGFAMMASIVSPLLYLCTVLFAAGAVALVVGPYAWYLLGGLWLVSLAVPGVYFTRRRLRPEGFL
jgi:hypothetical protein